MSEEREEEKNEVSTGSVSEDLSQISAMVELYPELMEDEHVKGLFEIASKASTEKKEDGAEEEEEEEEDEDEDSDEDEDDEDEDSDEDEDDEEEEEEDDIFGVGKKKSVEVNFELSDDIKKYLKDKYAMDDPNKFFNSVNTWRNDSQKFSETNSKLEELNSDLQSLPNEIKAAIGAYAEGGDYISAFGVNGKLDFNKPFDKQDEDDVVKHYYPDKYNAIIKKLDNDDLTEEEAEERILELKDVAKEIYNRDQKGIENERAALIRKEQERVKTVKNSASSSVDYLKEQFPNFKSADLQRIKKILVDGNFDSHIYERNGAIKKDAAFRLAFYLHGDTILERVKGISKNKGITEANLEIAKKGNKQLNKNKSTSAIHKEQKAEDAISHLNVHMQSDPYS